jgi:23S rRNA pseudouridine1911/1915/1917 synthase
MQPLPEAQNIELMVQQSAVRLDKYLAAHLPQISRSRLQKLIHQGNVLLNGQHATPHQILKAGDAVKVVIPPAENEAPLPQPIYLDIIYEDEDIALINKSAGMTVHPAPGHKDSTLVSALLERYPAIDKVGTAARPGIVHRLDRDTSGIIIIAKNTPAWEHVSRQFKMREVNKTYLALVRGRLEPEQGVIEAPLGRHPTRRKIMAVVEGGREARTVYRVQQYFKGFTLLQVMPQTGRTHQIRVHLAAIGFPIVGDPVYGIRWPYLGRQFLHAFKLGFRLPCNNEFREFYAELPRDLEEVLCRLNAA